MSISNQHPVPLSCSFIIPWGCSLSSVWNGFVVQWEAEPLVLGFLALVKRSPSLSWAASFRKQQSHFPARDPVVLSGGTNLNQRSGGCP